MDLDGDVVAIRALRLKESSGEERGVLVRIHKPEPIDNGANYHCRISFEGFQPRCPRGAYGVDSIQALQLALVLVASALSTSVEYRERRLRWLDDSDDLGFPLGAYPSPR